MKENQVNQWKNHPQFTSDMTSLRDERQKAWKIGREETNLTQMMKGNIEALPVINYFSFTLTFRIQSMSHIQMIPRFFLHNNYQTIEK